MTIIKPNPWYNSQLFVKKKGKHKQLVKTLALTDSITSSNQKAFKTVNGTSNMKHFAKKKKSSLSSKEGKKILQFSIKAPEFQQLDSISTKAPEFQQLDPIVTNAKIIFKEDRDGPYMEVSVLEAIWTVEWDNLVSLQWNKNWNDVHYETKVIIEDTKPSLDGYFLAINGLIKITAVGATSTSQNLQYETQHIPFDCTVINPLEEEIIKEEKHTEEAPLLYKTYPTVSTGDWEVKVIKIKHRKNNDGLTVSDVMISIFGRVWWFRKRLIPVILERKN